MEQVAIIAVLRAAEVALLASAFGLIFSTTGIFHLPFAPLFTGTIYLSIAMIRSGFPVGLAMLLGLVAVAVIALGMHLAIYEPILTRGGGLLALLITAVGLYTVLEALLSIPLGFQPITLIGDLPSFGTVRLGSLPFSIVELGGFVVHVLLLAAVVLFLRGSRVGALIRATGENPKLAHNIGINLTKWRAVAMILGTLMAGIVSITAGWTDGSINLGVGLPAALAGTVGAFLGGMNKLSGPIVGGAVLGVIEVIAADQLSTGWATALVFGGLVFVILFRPEGLIVRNYTKGASQPSLGAS